LNCAFLTHKEGLILCLLTNSNVYFVCLKCKCNPQKNGIFELHIQRGMWYFSNPQNHRHIMVEMSSKVIIPAYSNSPLPPNTARLKSEQNNLTSFHPPACNRHSPENLKKYSESRLQNVSFESFWTFAAQTLRTQNQP